MDDDPVIYDDEHEVYCDTRTGLCYECDPSEIDEDDREFYAIDWLRWDRESEHIVERLVTERGHRFDVPSRRERESMALALRLGQP